MVSRGNQSGRLIGVLGVGSILVVNGSFVLLLLESSVLYLSSRFSRMRATRAKYPDRVFVQIRYIQPIYKEGLVDSDGHIQF
jgi:hypothetical protein